MIRRNGPVKKKRTTPRRVSVLRCRAYLDWLHGQPCVIGRLYGFPPEIVQKPHLNWKIRIIDPAHGPTVGLRVKGPDNEAISLCRFHHDQQTAWGWEAFEKRYDFDRAAEAKKLYALFLGSSSPDGETPQAKP